MTQQYTVGQKVCLLKEELTGGGYLHLPHFQTNSWVSVNRMKTGKEPKNRPRGRRRRRPWLNAGSLSTLTISMRINSSMTQMLLGQKKKKKKRANHWDALSSIYSPLSCVCSGRRLVSFGSGWWVWRPRSLISVRNLKDKNMTWVSSSSSKIF